MPRGVRKNGGLDDQLQKIDAQIEALQKQRAQILDQKREEDAKKLTDFLSQNHISLSDALTYLSPAIAASTSESASEV